MRRRRIIRCLVRLAKDYHLRSKELRDAGEYERAMDFELVSCNLVDIANTYKLW